MPSTRQRGSTENAGTTKSTALQRSEASQTSPSVDDAALKPDPIVQATVDNLVAFWPNDGSAVVLRREATQAERGRLQLRQRDIISALRPLSIADKERASRALAVMFLGMPTMRNIDSEATVAAYVYALADLPLFAVLAACDDVMKNRVAELDPDYPIMAARMVNLAKRHTAPLHGEILMLQKTLSAKQETILSPEERARVAKGIREMADSLKRDREIERRANMKDMALVLDSEQAILREYKRLGVEPRYMDKEKTILLSPELAGIKEKKNA